MYRFSENTFNRLFPFYILLDEGLSVASVGSSLALLVGKQTVGTSFFDRFRIARPRFFEPSVAGLMALERQLIILEPVAQNGFRLRGQFEAVPEMGKILFAGSPWFNNIEEVRQHGLNIGHFALHDPLTDLLMVLQSQKIAADDIQEMLVTISKQKSELKKLGRIIEETINSVIITDPQGHIEWVNRAFETTTGFALKEIAGKKPGSFLQGKDSAPDTIQYLRNKIRSLENFECEIVNYKKSGESYWVKISGQPYFDNEGRTIGFFAIEEDITEKKERQKKLDQQRVFYENVLDNIPVEIAVFAPDQTYRFINHTSLPDKTAREALIGKNVRDFVRTKNINPGIALQREKMFELMKASKKHIDFEEHEKDEAGKDQYRLRNYHPILDENHDITNVIGFGININDIKQKQFALETSEANMKKLLDNLIEAVVKINKESRITFVNPIWTELLGFSISESIGQYLDIFLPSGLCETIKGILHQEINFSQSKQSIGKETPCFTKSENKIYIDVAISPSLQVGSDKPEMMIFITDVTEQKISKERLRDIAEKERNLNELKSSFLNMVSHELRTPLAIIQSTVEMINIEMEIGATDPAKLLEDHHSIKSEIDGMIDIMNELLLLGKTESEQIKIKPRSVMPQAFIGPLLAKNFGPWEDGRSCEVRYKGNEEPIAIDMFSTTHLLTNVLHNAFKYSPGRETVKMTVRVQKEYWCVLVVDNGIGIAQKDLKNLFTSFKRGSNVGKIPGTGIGMVLVNYFLRMIKGQIHLKSTIGKGTCVYIRFPKTLI